MRVADGVTRRNFSARVSTFGETRSFAKSTAFDSSTARNAQELYSLAKAQEFHYW